MCALATRWQLHQSHAHLMLEARVGDALPAVDQIVDVIQSVKVADGCHPVFLEQISVQLDDVTGLRIQANDVDAASKGLQIRIGASGFPKGIHHVKRVLVAVEIQRLESRAAAGLEPVDTCITSCFDGR